MLEERGLAEVSQFMVVLKAARFEPERLRASPDILKFNNWAVKNINIGVSNVLTVQFIWGGGDGGWLEHRCSPNGGRKLGGGLACLREGIFQLCSERDELPPPPSSIIYCHFMGVVSVSGHFEL